MLAIEENRLAYVPRSLSRRPARCVVLASEGYPGNKLDMRFRLAIPRVVFVYHAGTKLNKVDR